MFKKILLSIIMLMFCGVSFGDVSKDRINFNTMSTTDGIVTEVRLMIDDMNTQLRNAGGRTSNAGTGDTYYVDSGLSSSGIGTRPEWGTTTLDAAVALCTANNGDVIAIIQNHGENFTAADAADIDVAGVAVIGLGDGTDAPELSYTAQAGELVVGAANVYLYNLRFVAATNAVTMGISVEAGGDNLTIVGCTFPEPATATYEFVDAIDLASGADGFEIYNCVYRHVSTTGPAHFIEMGNGVNQDFRIVGNDIAGEFSVSAIWSNDIDWWGHIGHNTISNLTASQHAIEFTAAAEGMIVYNNIYTDVSTSSIDPGSMFCIENYVCEAINQSGVLYPEAP